MITLNVSLITQTLLLERQVRMELCWQTMVKSFCSQQIQRSFTSKIKTNTKSLILHFRKLQGKLKRCSKFGLVNQTSFACIQLKTQMTRNNILQFGDSAKAMIKNSETFHMSFTKDIKIQCSSRIASQLKTKTSSSSNTSQPVMKEMSSSPGILKRIVKKLISLVDLTMYSSVTSMVSILIEDTFVSRTILSTWTIHSPCLSLDWILRRLI